MSLLDTLASDFKPVAQELHDLAVRAGVRPRITSARRSYAKQQALYKAFLQGRSRYPAAAPGTSAHEYGYAFDMIVDNPTDQTDLGLVWTDNFGQVYGGEEDPIHFQAASFRAPASVSVDQERASTGGLNPSFGKPGSTADRLADVLITALPWTRILGIPQLVAAIYSAAGGQEDILVFWLGHPAEFLRDIFDLMWTLAKASLGF